MVELGVLARVGVVLLVSVAACGGRAEVLPAPPSVVPPPPTEAVSNCPGAYQPARLMLPERGNSTLAVGGSRLVVVGWEQETGDGSVSVLDFTDGSVRTLASNRESPSEPSLTTRFAYWLDQGQGPESSTGPQPLQLSRAPLDGSSPAERASAVDGGPTTTLAEGDTVYFGHDLALAAISEGMSSPIDLAANASPLDLAIFGDYLYWPDCSHIQRIPKAGGASEIVTDGYCSLKVATDGSDVYFVDYEGQSDSTIQRAPATGGPASLVTAGSQIAVDDVNLYYADTDGLHRMPKAGGAAELLATGIINDIALDSNCIYWADTAAHALYMLRK